MEEERKALIAVTQELDAEILSERNMLEQIHCHTDIVRTKYLTLQLENDCLSKEIEAELKKLADNGARTEGQIDQVKQNLIELSQSVQISVDSADEVLQEERKFFIQWKQMIMDLPNQWFFKDDHSINEMIREMNSKVDEAKKAVGRLGEQVQLEKKQLLVDLLSRRKDADDVSTFVIDLKRTIARINHMKSNP